MRVGARKARIDGRVSEGRAPATEPPRVTAPESQLPLDIQSVGGGDAAVPVSRVLDRALLASEVRVDQAVPLCVPFRPLEIVEQAPRVVRANAGPVRDRSCELGEHLAVPLNSAR